MYHVGAHYIHGSTPSLCIWRDDCVFVVDIYMYIHTAICIHNWKHAESVAWTSPPNKLFSPGTLRLAGHPELMNLPVPATARPPYGQSRRISTVVCMYVVVHPTAMQHQRQGRWDIIMLRVLLMSQSDPQRGSSGSVPQRRWMPKQILQGYFIADGHR